MEYRLARCIRIDSAGTDAYVLLCEMVMFQMNASCCVCYTAGVDSLALLLRPCAACAESPSISVDSDGCPCGVLREVFVLSLLRTVAIWAKGTSESLLLPETLRFRRRPRFFPPSSTVRLA